MPQSSSSSEFLRILEVHEEEVKRIVFPLEVLRRVRGKVIGDTGQGIEQVRVFVALDFPAERATDASGRFEFLITQEIWDALEEGERLQFVAREQEGKAVGSAGVSGWEEEVVIRLGPGATVRGRVVDRQGNGAAKAKVEACLSGGNMAGAFAETVADKNGMFKIHAVPKGVEVTAFGSAENAFRAAMATVTVQKDETQMNVGDMVLLKSRSPFRDHP